ncbi:MAG: amidohydrolase family protein, partial [Nocardioidaceae bacterium]
MTRTLFRNGYVHTPADPHATALCIDGDEIVWTGDDEASAHFVDAADLVVDLRGRLVTPAFVDAHAHLAQTGMTAHSVDLSEATSLRTALDAVA